MKLIPASIANGASLSAAVDLFPGETIVGIVMPSAWTAAGLTFQVSVDGVTFQDKYTFGGTEYNATVVANHYVGIPADDFRGSRQVKLRSGTGSVPVNQGALANFTLVVINAEPGK